MTPKDSKCSHDDGYAWEQYWVHCLKKDYPACPFCKPVEPKCPHGISNGEYCDGCDCIIGKPVEPCKHEVAINGVECRKCRTLVTEFKPVEPERCKHDVMIPDCFKCYDKEGNPVEQGKICERCGWKLSYQTPHICNSAPLDGVKTAKEKLQSIAKECHGMLESYLCEITPSICKDSEQPEWSSGELKNLIAEFWSVVAPFILSEMEKSESDHEAAIQSLQRDLQLQEKARELSLKEHQALESAVSSAKYIAEEVYMKKIKALEDALKTKEEEIEERVNRNRLQGYKDGKKENENEVKQLKNELYRIRCVAERLKNSDDENEISVEENIAGKYMLKVLDGENFS